MHLVLLMVFHSFLITHISGFKDYYELAANAGNLRMLVEKKNSNSINFLKNFLDYDFHLLNFFRIKWHEFCSIFTPLSGRFKYSIH